MAMLNKDEVREIIRQRRSRLDQAESEAMDRAVFCRLRAHPLIEAAECVYAYMALRGETGTKDLISFLWREGRRVAVPRVIGRRMDFFLIRSMEDLALGGMGILEPLADCPQAGFPDAPVIVPGLAFTPEGMRIGYGGGCYDRFFEREPKHRKVAVAFDFQLFSELPQEPYDRRMDEIITPEHHYLCEEEQP